MEHISDRISVRVHLERKLSFKGEKYTFGSVFPHKVIQSYTVQYVITADGDIFGDALICLQKPTGRLGETVMSNIFLAPNFCVTCRKSGKLTSSHVKFFVDEMLVPIAEEHVLYILDSWTGHKTEIFIQKHLQLMMLSLNWK